MSDGDAFKSRGRTGWWLLMGVILLAFPAYIAALLLSAVL
jgi:hypothetical protein